jgi:hypothetical protein
MGISKIDDDGRGDSASGVFPLSHAARRAGAVTALAWYAAFESDTAE